MQVNGEASTGAEKRAIGPQNGISPVWLLRMQNAGPGLTAYARLPNLRHGIEKIVLCGPLPAHVDSVRVNVNGMTIIDSVPFVDDETGDRVTGGQSLALLAMFDGPVCEIDFCSEPVPIFWGCRGGQSLNPLPSIEVMVTLGAMAPWGAELAIVTSGS